MVRYTCATHEMVVKVTDIERTLGDDVTLVAPNSKSWVFVSENIAILLYNSNKSVARDGVVYLCKNV